MKRIKTSRYRLYNSDNMEALALMPDNSVHSVVVDPPYGLGKEPDAYEMMRQWYKTGHYDHKSKSGFMGKTWDAFVPQPNFWKEVYRVLKPGGYVLSFFGTRTYDIGTLAIRLAGFTIKNQIAWLYGTGFPKSQNVGKKIDAMLVHGRSDSVGIKAANKSRPGVARTRTNTSTNGIVGRSAKAVKETRDIAQTKLAEKWNGFGTDLKPAMEPICLAQKPLEGTYANNVLTHGVGALNIDGCRIPLGSVKDASDFSYNHNGTNRSKKSSGDDLGAYEGGWKVRKGEKTIPKGRFPANVIHDGSSDVLRAFGDKTSKSTGGSGQASKGGLGCNVYAGGWRGEPGDSLGGLGDSGSVARFFYCAKTSKSDRNEGLASHKDSVISNSSGKLLSLKKNINTSTGKHRNPTTVSKNVHPTVKPTALVRYLTRLITPRNGIVLDPYMGSGSTGKAAMLEGFRFIGMELDPDYFDIAEARIRHAAETVQPKSIFD